ncbi:type IV secretion protein Rhs [Burkholderia sp. KK1]|nr:type IV secretion protein Rhs [Burkholderia sp. KK1]
MNSLADRMLANKRFDFTSEAFGADKFAVVEMEGFESISQPFRFVLTLVSDDASIDFDTMLNHRASFTIYGPEGGIRAPYHGVLAEFEQLHRADGYVFYRAVLVPRLWRLSLFRISEVYLDERPITETVRGVLETGRLNSADYEFKLTGTYRPRTFVCQYQETYLDFVSRWLEKEGIYYYFDHSGGSDKLVVIDDKIMHDAHALPVSYRPDDALDTGLAADSVRDFVCRQKPLPHEVVLQDYNYRKAAVQLKARATVSDSGIGEVMLYGENFRDQQEGDRYAKLRAQELICGGKAYSGEGTALGLRSGYFFTLAQHYRDDFNGRYLVTEVHHEGSQAGALLNGVSSPYSDGARGGEIVYRNSFRAIPAATQFRPERVTAKPRVAGTMNATIDSEGDGQYAELDEYGQYKVQLPFDKTDKNANKSSARLRMATPYAGTDHGMHFPLHKDAEVLLSFIDGDPDQPVIVGSLANSENANIVTQTNAHANEIKTAGGNHLYLGDSAGKEAIWLHSPFHNSSIGIGSTDPKGGGSLWSSTAGSSESITVGASNKYSVGPNTTVSLGPGFTASAAVSTSFTMSASTSFAWTSDVSWKKGQSISLHDGDSLSLKEQNKLKGTDSVTISGGQDPAAKLAFDAAKKKIQYATAFNVAANLATAAAAAGMLGKADDDNGGAGKIGPWISDGYKTMFPMVAGGIVGGAIAHGLLYAGAKAFAAADAAATYASEIKADSTGINLSVKVASPAPAPVNNVQITPTFVEVNAPTISLNAKSLIDLTSNDDVVVDAMSVLMTGETSVSVKGETISLASGDSSATVAPTSVQLNSSAVQFNATSVIDLTSNGDLLMDAVGITMTSANKVEVTAVQVNVDAPTIAISGEVIRLG